MRIDANFDSGNIEIIDLSEPHHAKLAIRKDLNSHHFQWFHFLAADLAQGQHYQFSLLNAAQAAYPHAWDGYQAVASYDQRNWFRVPTTYVDGVLSFSVTSEAEQLWFAYFEPYSREQHEGLINIALDIAGVELYASGRSLEGRALEILHVKSAHPKPRKVWIIAQQHPGEHMAEWFMQGIVEQLETGSVPALDQVELYLVPNMNPDGAYRGHLRTNAAGVDLNRAWQNANDEQSPEVAFVLKHMQATGVDLFLDIHGDEAIPHVFTAGCEGNPGYSERLERLENAFRSALLAQGAEYQTLHGYARDLPGQANMTLACNAVGERFDCLAFTLEMPFKDHNDAPNPKTGWNGQRSKRLGQDVLAAIAKVADQLR